jgi:hypothetical protein
MTRKRLPGKWTSLVNSRPLLKLLEASAARIAKRMERAQTFLCDSGQTLGGTSDTAAPRDLSVSIHKRLHYRICGPFFCQERAVEGELIRDMIRPASGMCGVHG